MRTWCMLAACRAAAALCALRRLGLGSGLLLAVPIPPQHAGEGAAVQAAIETALLEAQAKSVQGNQVPTDPCIHASNLVLTYSMHLPHMPAMWRLVAKLLHPHSAREGEREGPAFAEPQCACS